MTDGTTIKAVDYLDGFETEERGSRMPVGALATQLSNNEQYAGNILQFFPHAEGYVKVTPLSLGNNIAGYAYNYVFNYIDHLGNVRVSYSKDPRTSQLKILEETEGRGSRMPVRAIATLSSNNEQYAGGILQFFPHAEGYVKATPQSNTPNGEPTSYTYNYVFNYTDHLGNIRVSYSKDPATNQLKILEENHYYPFGLKHSAYDTGSKRDFMKGIDPGEPPVRLEYVLETEYQYKYNGKELQDELGLGWYDYGWRNYDPALGRWMNVDPLAERYLSASPYTYVSNTPINALDPDGRYIIYRNDEMTLAYSNGNFYHATITQDKQGNYKTNLGEKYDAEKEKNLTVNALLATFNTIESSDDKDLKGQLSTLESSSNLHIYKDAKAGDGSNVTSEVIIQKGGNSLNIGKGKNESRHTITQLDFSFYSIMNYARIEGIAPCLSCTITHEMRHQYDYEIGNMSDDTGVSNNRNPVEIRAVNNENRIRKILGLPKRTSYGGKKIDSIKLK